MLAAGILILAPMQTAKAQESTLDKVLASGKVIVGVIIDGELLDYRLDV